MKNRLLITLALITCSANTLAHQQLYKVRVVESKPVYEYVSIEKPVQYCSDIHVNYNSQKASHIIAGSVVGGTIGNLASSRKSRDGATLVGAIIGGVIGSQIADTRPNRHPSTQCITRYESTEKVRVITGYNYWYRIKGKTYQGFSVEQPSAYVTLRKF